MILSFPAVESADPDTGLLAYGGDLEIPSLELAYRSGIFPWPSGESEPLLWFAPPERAILEFKSIHITTRLKRELKKSHFRFAVNDNFSKVVTACATVKNRKNQSGTWITRDILSAYCDFYQAGFAQSFETYNTRGELVGGMYGVLIGSYFAGESMFYLEKNASKFALLNAINYLQERGLEWMDIQIITPLLAQFGAIEIPRSEFMLRLVEAVAETAPGSPSKKVKPLVSI